MTLSLVRIYNCPTYSIGKLYVDGVWLCDTIEDYDRGLDQSMSPSEIAKIKVKRLTAIPTGTFRVTMNVQSPKMSKMKYYADFCKGYLPRLLNVPGYDGILIHCGSSAASSAGCIIVGYNTVKGKVTNSRKAWEALMNNHLLPAKKRGESITILVSRKYAPPPPPPKPKTPFSGP
ncbi:MAG: hypothetical protein IKH88_09900 [Prevotella sp.]|nr:hypothetical protein [Prevotella sp.]MBR7055220.1 hypothetical protein [Prevotella sp.]